MSSPSAEPVEADIQAWIDAAGADPVLRLRRRVSHIVLAAIGLSPRLGEDLVLKGGTLMAIAFGSPRNTSDLDFTAKSEPVPFAEMLRDELNQALERATILTGALDIECRVQKIEKQPKPASFAQATAPALTITVGYVNLRADIHPPALERQRQKLRDGRAPDALKIDISFNESVLEEQRLRLKGAAASILAYSAEEVIAEKLRALLQQPERNRARRQDVFDIHYFLTTRTLDDASQATILTTLLEKCRSRGMDPKRDSMDGPEVRQMALKEWATLADELEELPDFDTLFEQVRAFYASLPWHTLS